MKSIRFSDDELEFLKQHYEMELAEMEKYMAEIKMMLKKLGSVAKEAGEEGPKKRRGRPPMTEQEKVKRGKAKASARAKKEVRKNVKKGEKPPLLADDTQQEGVKD